MSFLFPHPPSLPRLELWLLLACRCTKKENKTVGASKTHQDPEFPISPESGVPRLLCRCSWDASSVVLWTTDDITISNGGDGEVDEGVVVIHPSHNGSDSDTRRQRQTMFEATDGLGSLPEGVVWRWPISETSLPSQVAAPEFEVAGRTYKVLRDSSRAPPPQHQTGMPWGMTRRWPSACLLKRSHLNSTRARTSTLPLDGDHTSVVVVRSSPVVSCLHGPRQRQAGEAPRHCIALCNSCPDSHERSGWTARMMDMFPVDGG